MTTSTTDTSVVQPARSAPTRKPRFTPYPRIKAMTEAENIAFKDGNYTSVYAAGATEVVPRFLGDDTGATPIFFGRSQSWNDTVSSTVDRYSPTFGQAMLLRLWVPTPEAAKKLEAEIPQHLGENLKKLRGKAYDLKADMTLEDLQLEIMELAEAFGIEVFDDEQLITRLGK